VASEQKFRVLNIVDDVIGRGRQRCSLHESLFAGLPAAGPTNNLASSCHAALRCAPGRPAGRPQPPEL